MDELDGMIDGDEVHVAGWMPGSDWTATDWEPIYTIACHGDYDQSAKCFGLFVWVAMMNHEENWPSFGRRPSPEA